MKKAYIILKAITLYLMVTIDRFAMAIFTGVELPAISRKKLEVIESTTDEEINQEIEAQDAHQMLIYKDYLPKAKKRALKAIAIVIAYKLIKWLLS